MKAGLMERFAGQKRDVEAALEAMGRIAADQKDDKAERGLQALRAKLRANTFNLVVMGQFKRGKSTFINALLGRDLLPVGVLPLTSAITRISYGSRARARVNFEDGRSREISPEELAAYVTEKENPENIKGIRDVEIQFPSGYLTDGVVLTDTPGIGSAYLHNTEVTYNYLPKADAVIFVLAVDPPVTENELQFLADVRKLVPRIFFLQNKIDHVDAAEREEVLDFTRDILRRELGVNEIKVFPISARTALAARLNGNGRDLEKSGLPTFLASLDRFLLEEKGNVLLLSTVMNALKLLFDLEFGLQVELRATNTSARDLAGKVERLDRELEEVERRRRETAYLLRGEIERLVEALDEDTARFKEKTTADLTAEVEERYRRKKELASKELNADLEHFFQRRLREVFDAWVPAEGERVREEFERITGRFNREADETVARIRGLYADLFDIKPESFAGAAALVRESSLWYKLEDAKPFFPSIDPLALSFVLPRQLVHGFILKKIREKVAHFMDMNSGRARYDFFERIRESRFRFESALKERIDTTLDGLHAAVERARVRQASSSMVIKGSARRLQEYLRDLEGVKSRLVTLRGHLES